MPRSYARAWRTRGVIRPGRARRRRSTGCCGRPAAPAGRARPSACAGAPTCRATRRPTARRRAPGLRRSRWPATCGPRRPTSTLSVSRLPLSRVVELGTALDEQLHHVVASLHRRAHQRRAALVVGVVRVEAEVQQHPDGLDVLLGRALVGDAFHPADAGRRGQARCRRSTVRALGSALYFEQQLHQRGVARLRGADERRGAFLPEPLHREDGAGQRVLLDRRVRVAPLSSSAVMISR